MKQWSAADVFQGELVDKDGNKSSCEDLSELDAVGIYFSAHWCPPCRGFTPKLAEWYTANAEKLQMEIVFASSDRDEGAFNDYFGEMPWKALPYDARKLKDALSKKFKVSGIPAFVIVDAEGNLVTDKGRNGVDSDATGANFPWKPK